MNVQHSRFKRISVKTCHNNSFDQETSALKIILFKSKYKLRSHAIKHFTNTLEFETIWKNYLPKNIGSLAKYITDLENIECPFFKSIYDTPPCHKCRIFKHCTPYASGIENTYLAGIEDVIIEDGNLPRYTIFFSKKFKNETFSGLSNNRVILKASIIEKDIFNLTTCYVKIGKPLVEIMSNEVAKILAEADNQSIKWCNKSKWGIGISIDDQKKNIKKSPNSPYRRGSGGNWKQYLDETEDW